MTEGTYREVEAELQKLSSGQIEEFVAIVRAQLPQEVRATLSRNITSPYRRLEADLKALLSLDAIAGDAARATWLDAARSALGAGDFDRMRERGIRAVTPRPRGDANGFVPEKTKIDLRDDMVDIDWLAKGHRASLSVAYLEVPRIFAGARANSVSGGTAFLIDQQHVFTAFHVVEARDRDSEKAAVRTDLEEQIRGATAMFDYTERASDGSPKGTRVHIAAMVAADEKLDYAVLRLAAPVSIAPLSLWKGGLPKIDQGLGFAVNIVQHPDRRPKQLALRNNAVWKTDGKRLHYFTDTLGGSSGSPVFNDAWKVIALHTGFDWFDNASYMGRKLGYANRGTLMSGILAHFLTTQSGVALDVDG